MIVSVSYFTQIFDEDVNLISSVSIGFELQWRVGVIGRGDHGPVFT
jgi:hypothetical protein